jgi:hypothetical protein
MYGNTTRPIRIAVNCVRTWASDGSCHERTEGATPLHCVRLLCTRLFIQEPQAASVVAARPMSLPLDLAQGAWHQKPLKWHC